MTYSSSMFSCILVFLLGESFARTFCHGVNLSFSKPLVSFKFPYCLSLCKGLVTSFHIPPSVRLHLFRLVSSLVLSAHYFISRLIILENVG